jgi:EpsI family protein
MKQRVRTVATCLLGGGLLMAYAGPLAAMVQRWDGSPMYSYAYTVPPIALYLLWSRREELRRQPSRPARLAGGIVIAGALTLLALGQVAAFQVVQQVSFLIALAGIVIFLFGMTHLRIWAPALSYLLFMIPLWDVFTEPLHWPFQNNSAKLGVALLHTIGIPAYREGTVIALPGVTIEVARQCSGVNYLVAVLALALPLSLLRLRQWWRRMLLVTVAMGIAALANGLRVALIGALAHWEIGSPLHGPFHVLHGLFVAAVGYIVLFVGLRVLEAREKPAPVTEASAEPAAPPHPMWTTPTVTGLAIVFWSVALLSTRTMAVPVALATPLDRLPLQLGSWTIAPLANVNEDPPADWNSADSQIFRRYRTNDGRTASVGIWYFESQRQDHEIVNAKVGVLHRNAVSHTMTIGNGSTLTVNIVRAGSDIGIFWYELDGVPEASQHVAKLRSLWTALTSRRSNGAAIMLRSPLDGHSETETLRALGELAGHVHAALARQWRSAEPRITPSAPDTTGRRVS